MEREEIQSGIVKEALERPMLQARTPSKQKVKKEILKEDSIDDNILQMKKKVKTEARNTIEGIALTKAELAVFRAAKQRENHEKKERKKRGGSKVKPKAKAKAKPKKTAVQKLGSVRNKAYNPVKKRM